MIRKPKTKKVHISIDESFYRNIFEPERKRLCKVKGVNFTIPNFTEYMAKSGVKFKYPKNEYIPKKFKPLKKPINKKLKNKYRLSLF